MKDKNIGLLIPSLRGGGAERVVSNLSLYLPDNFKVHIIVFDNKDIYYPYKGKLINLAVKHSDSIVGKVQILFKRVIKLRKVKKQFKLDLVLSFMEGPNIINLLAGGRGRDIISVRNNINDSYQDFCGFIYKILIRILYNKADDIVVLSNILKEQLVNDYAVQSDKIRIIENPFPLEEIRRMADEPLEQEYRKFFEKPVLINMGRLTAQKGQDILIKAFKLLKEDIPDLRLLILGQGERELELKELSLSLGLANDILFAGFQKNPFKFLARASVFVFPSLYEGLGNAAVEALACGLPVVAFDIESALREILRGNRDYKNKDGGIEMASAGVLVDMGEIPLLASAVKALLKDDDLRESYSLHGRERVEEYSLENIIKKWIELMDRD